MKVLAIDASSKSTGIAIFQDEKLIHYQCIIATDNSSFKRIVKMKNRILEIYKKYKPTNIIMEDVLPQDVKHNQSVYKVLIYLQAIIVFTLLTVGYTYLVYKINEMEKYFLEKLIKFHSLNFDAYLKILDDLKKKLRNDTGDDEEKGGGES